MATKLKNLRLTSVDLVRAGANQEADICLYKSADQDPPTAREEGIFKRFLNWLKDNPAEEAPEESVEKGFVTFDQVNDNRENQDRLWRYIDTLGCSLRSRIASSTMCSGIRKPPPSRPLGISASKPSFS